VDGSAESSGLPGAATADLSQNNASGDQSATAIVSQRHARQIDVPQVVISHDDRSDAPLNLDGAGSAPDQAAADSSAHAPAAHQEATAQEATAQEANTQKATERHS
jgi:hypothetical protein